MAAGQEAPQERTYHTELRRGVAGNGTTVYCLFVLAGTRTVALHYFPTQAEALAFHACGTTYGPLEDWS